MDAIPPRKGRPEAVGAQAAQRGRHGVGIVLVRRQVGGADSREHEKVGEGGAATRRLGISPAGELAQRFDVVLIDGAAGLSPQSMITVLAAQHVVMVTNPEIAALTDAYAVIKCLARQAARPEVHVVVNRAPDPGLGAATFERLADVSGRFARLPIHYLGAVPEDPTVSHRRLGHAPLMAEQRGCETTEALELLVEGLEARVVETNLAATSEGVEARMLAQVRRW